MRVCEKAQLLTCSHHVQGITKMSKSRQRGPLSLRCDGESPWAPSLSEGKRPTDTRPALLTSSPSSHPQPPSTSKQLRFFVIGQQFKTKIFWPSSPFFNSTPLWWALFWQILLIFFRLIHGLCLWEHPMGCNFWKHPMDCKYNSRSWFTLRAIRCWWHFKDGVRLWKT